MNTNVDISPAGEDRAVAGPTLLVVDDEKSMLQIFRRKMEKWGFRVHTASSGQEALEILGPKEIDILVTDVTMPGMTGIELMQAALRLQPDLQCIVMTGYGEIETAVQAMRLGAINYFCKPLDFESLRMAIRNGSDRIAAERQVRHYREQLEKLVEERTAELREANAQLRKEILERQLAEQEAESRRRQLIEADKLMSLGVLVAGVAHEINNPNSFIMMNAPILRRAWMDLVPLLDSHSREHGDFNLAGLPYSEMRGHIPELFAGITDGAERIKQIVMNLKDYARKDVSDLNQQVSLNEVLKAALTLLASSLKKCTRHLEVRYADDLPAIKGNFQRIEQVLINVIQNSCQALVDPSRRILIATSRNPLTDEVVVMVRDEGIGIPLEHLKQIKDPFFTTRRDCGGTGLGLSISAGIMEEHGGSLLFESQVGEGTTARLIFPSSARGSRNYGSIFVENIKKN
jgi:C4-dicarboxylate-specific signal transduction histidine kinase